MPSLPGVAVVREDDEPTAANVEELFPPAVYFEQTEVQPALRQAIVAHLREYPTVAFSVADLALALVRRNWVGGQSAQKRVSDMASVMHGEEQLQRVDRGVHRLHPRLAAAFERRPVTDYRRAAEMGFPVPEATPDDQE